MVLNVYSIMCVSLASLLWSTAVLVGKDSSNRSSSKDIITESGELLLHHDNIISVSELRMGTASSLGSCVMFLRARSMRPLTSVRTRRFIRALGLIFY